MEGNNLARVSVCLSTADGPRHFLPVNDTWWICFFKGGRKWNLMWEIMVADGNGADVMRVDSLHDAGTRRSGRKSCKFLLR
jgi:hypothetical protein